MLLSNPLILVAVFLLSATASPLIFDTPQHPLRPEMPSSPNTPTQNGTDLRILPLGNSITWGYGSSTGNGYRQFLLDRLSPTNNVTYIGSEHSGNMTNNENEGHPGAQIFHIALYADLSLPQRPNVILLMAGTNDVMANNGLEEAPGRLGILIDRCLEACPDATVLVAQLTDVVDRPAHARTVKFNQAVPGVVKKRVEKGKKVAVVNMFDYVTTDGLMDGLHPSDIGYNGMAKGWYDGIVEAEGKGWITKPVKIKQDEEKEGEIEGF